MTEQIRDADGLVVRTVTASEWTSGDRVLLLALGLYLDTLCPGCGEPRERAWHPAMEGWYEVAVVSCNGCAAREKVKTQPHQRVALHDSYDEAENGFLGALPRVRFMDPEDIEDTTLSNRPAAPTEVSAAE